MMGEITGGAAPGHCAEIVPEGHGGKTSSTWLASLGRRYSVLCVLRMPRGM